ncbi:MAG: GAF domain-containing protein [Polyangiaceae bacterium]
MGERLAGFFHEAERLGGLPAKARLASLARVTSSQAETVEDSRELVASVSAALDALKRELARRSVPDLSGDIPVPRPQSSAAIDLPTGPARAPLASKPRYCLDVIAELVLQRSIVFEREVDAVRRLNEASAKAIEVARVSTWLLDRGGSKITCLDLFERASGRHSSGIELFERDYPSYFRALAHERTILATNALTDRRTSCFAKSYLTPLGIGAMLDAPIWVDGRMIGVICHEHVGGPRLWVPEEESFALVIAGLLATFMEVKHWREAP